MASKIINDDGSLRCPKCGKSAFHVPLYRDRPHGEVAKFVCEECLPEDMKPSDEIKKLVEAINGN